MTESITQVMELVQRAQRAIHRSKLATGARAPWHKLSPNLTMAQLRALMAIEDCGRLSVGQLAERLGTGMPAASSIVDRLVEEGLAERHQDPVDRRRIVVSPSKEGSARIDTMRQGPREVLEALLGRFSPSELQSLVQGLEAFARAAEELADEADAKAAAATAGTTAVSA